MRPRDAINRRKKSYLTIVAAGFGVLTVLAFTEQYLPKSLSAVLKIAAGAVFAAGVLLVYFGIKCPKCGKTLGMKFVYAEETLVRCPRCGVNFDEGSS